MKLEAFFEKFELFADAPDAVGKMRELVLELAFRGRLADRDPDDEPATNLMGRVQSLKEQLVKQRKIKRVAVEPDPREQAPTSLPPGWLWTRLGNCFDVRDGTHDSPKYTDEGFPLITSKNIYTGSLSFDGAHLISENDHRQICERSRVDRGDILFAMIGSIGNPVIVNTDREFSIKNVALFKYYSASDAEPRFLLLYLRLVAEEMKKKALGAVQSFVSLGFLRNYLFPLPPLAEQKRIVAKVDELMALCDRLEAQQQERQTRHTALARASLARFADAPTPANLDFLFHKSYDIPPAELRKAILILAVQGKLVTQHPADESALALLDRIATHKRVLAKAGRLRGSATVKAMHDDEAEFELPSSWCWVRFGDIMINRDGERIPVSREERETKPKIYDYYGASGVIDKIDGYLFDKPLLLIGEDGANLINRSTPIAFIARGQYWVNNHAHVLDGISEDFLQFIELHINAINLEKYVTGSAQPKMNQAKMNSIPIALPPLAEQGRIVARVKQLTALVEELESQLLTARSAGTELLDAVLVELTQGRALA